MFSTSHPTWDNPKHLQKLPHILWEPKLSLGMELHFVLRPWDWPQAWVLLGRQHHEGRRFVCFPSFLELCWHVCESSVNTCFAGMDTPWITGHVDSSVVHTDLTRNDLNCVLTCSKHCSNKNLQGAQQGTPQTCLGDGRPFLVSFPSRFFSVPIGHMGPETTDLIRHGQIILQLTSGRYSWNLITLYNKGVEGIIGR